MNKPKKEFTYMNNEVNPYQFFIVEYNNINPDDYITVSYRGVTLNRNGLTEFYSLSDWLK